MACLPDLQKTPGRLMLYFGVMAVVMMAIEDSRKAGERRLEILIQRLEKKGSL